MKDKATGRTVTVYVALAKLRRARHCCNQSKIQSQLGLRTFKDKPASPRAPSRVLVRRAPSGSLVFMFGLWGHEGRIAPANVPFEVLVCRTLLSSLDFEEGHVLFGCEEGQMLWF